MYNRSIFVVIPCHNEGSVIGSTIASLLAGGWSVVVVDDGSTDNSWDVLARFPVHSLRHPLNLGQGAALQTGIQYALLRNAQVIVTFDADGQHPADQVCELVEPILHGECDVVLGSRFLRESDRRLVPPLKAFVLRLGILVSGWSTGVWLHDTHNGFRALSRHAASSIRLREAGFAHATEILEEIRHAGLRYLEKPVTIRYSDYSRAKGQSVLNSLNIVVDLLLRKLFR